MTPQVAAPSWFRLPEVLWQQFWQVSLMIALACVVAPLIGRQRPHLAYLLWLVVLAKCLTPPIWSSPTSVFSWSLSEREDRTPVASTKIDWPEPVAEGVMGGRALETEVVDSHLGSAVADAPPRGADSGFRISWTMGLFSIWAVGAIVYMGYLGVSWLQCLRIVRAGDVLGDARTARIATDDASAAFDQLSPSPRQRTQQLFASLVRDLNMRTIPRLVIVDKPLGPAAIGYFRPTIVLPARLVEQTSEEDLRTIIAHELVHVRRRDVCVAWLQVLAGCVWWFHPLVWWTNRQVVRWREAVCDEEVIAELSLRPRRYADALLRVLESRMQPLSALQVTMAHGEVTAARIARLMRQSTFLKRTPLWCWAAAIVAAIALLPGGGLKLVAQQAASDEQKDVPQVVSDDVDASDEVPVPATGAPTEARRTVDPQVEKYLSLYEAACESIKTWDVELSSTAFVSSKFAGASRNGQAPQPYIQSDVRSSRQIYSNGRYRTDLLSMNGSEAIPGTNNYEVWSWDHKTGVAQKLNGTRGMVVDGPRATERSYGALWTETFQEFEAGYPYSRCFRERPAESTKIEVTEEAVRLTVDGDPNAASFNNLGFCLVLDVNRSFMPRAIEITIDGRLWIRYENTLQEISPGVWAPVICRRSTFDIRKDGDGGLMAYEDMRIDLSKAQFNQPIDEDRFPVHFPDNTAVVDIASRMSDPKGFMRAKLTSTLTIPFRLSDFVLHPSGDTVLAAGWASIDDQELWESGDIPGVTELVEVESGRQVVRFQDVYGAVLCVALSQDGRIAATGGRQLGHRTKGELKLWDATTGELRKTLAGHDNWIHSVAFSADGNYLASAGRDGFARVWSTETGEIVKTLGPYEIWPASVCFDSHSRLLVVSSRGVVDIFDGRSWTKFKNADLGNDGQYRVRQAAISPDGKRVGIAGLKGSRGDSDGWLVLWDSTSDQTLQLETGKVTNSCVAFSSDGRFIAASGWNKPTKIWELQNNATYRPIAFLGTKGALNWRTDSVNIAFLPKVRTVIVSRMTEAIEFWGF